MNGCGHGSARAMLTSGEDIVRVTVAKVRGSSPREAGATMLVSATAQSGTIGGGHLEWQATEQARRMLAASELAGHCVQELRLGPDLAQCCGGEVTLQFDRVAGATREQLLAMHEAEDAAHRRPLWIFGAGHVGSAVVRLLEELPLYEVTWIDNRAPLLPDATPAHVHARHAAEPVELVPTAPAGCAFLILTHDHELDFQLCAAILARGDAHWTGLIGSKSKAVRFRSRLRRAGYAGEAIAAIACPVGMTAIRSKLPAAIAVGIVAQLLALATREEAAPSRPAHDCTADCGRCREKQSA